MGSLFFIRNHFPLNGKQARALHTNKYLDIGKCINVYCWHLCVIKQNFVIAAVPMGRSQQKVLCGELVKHVLRHVGCAGRILPKPTRQYVNCACINIVKGNCLHLSHILASSASHHHRPIIAIRNIIIICVGKLCTEAHEELLWWCAASVSVRVRVRCGCATLIFDLAKTYGHA